MGLDGIEPSSGLYKNPVLTIERQALDYKYFKVLDCQNYRFLQGVSWKNPALNIGRQVQICRYFNTSEVQLQTVSSPWGQSLALLTISASTSLASLPYLNLLISLIISATLSFSCALIFFKSFVVSIEKGVTGSLFTIVFT